MNAPVEHSTGKWVCAVPCPPSIALLINWQNQSRDSENSGCQPERERFTTQMNEKGHP